MSLARITFVIATYRRVDALRCALESLRFQNLPDWTALVIGDCCGEETQSMLRSLHEPRLRYYNLPRRFGEQSGPNTFGLHLAQSQCIAFLNHDDLLLRDHLGHALSKLEGQRSDFFIGSFANITELRQDARGELQPHATRILPGTRDLRLLVHPDPYLFDPGSFWVIRTKYARAVGDWRPARTLWRTPLRDWLMRAWRRGGRFAFGDHITGVRFWTQNLRDSRQPLYAHQTPEHELMLERIEREPPEPLRACLESQAAQAQCDGGEAPFALVPMPRWRMLRQAMLYRWLGIDALARARRRQGIEPGSVLNDITRKRTGAALPEPWNVRDLLRDPESCRVI